MVKKVRWLLNSRFFQKEKITICQSHIELCCDNCSTYSGATTDQLYRACASLFPKKAKLLWILFVFNWCCMYYAINGALFSPKTKKTSTFQTFKELKFHQALTWFSFLSVFIMDSDLYDPEYLWDLRKVTNVKKMTFLQDIIYLIRFNQHISKIYYEPGISSQPSLDCNLLLSWTSPFVCILFFRYWHNLCYK